MRADPNPWWAHDHLNDGLGPQGIASGTPEEDVAPSLREAAEQLRQDRLEWARAESRAGWTR